MTAYHPYGLHKTMSQKIQFFHSAETLIHTPHTRDIGTDMAVNKVCNTLTTKRTQNLSIVLGVLRRNESELQNVF